MNKKRILIVTSEFPPQPGGIGNHAYHLALYLAKNQYEVQVIADQRDAENAEEVAFDATLPFAVQRIALRQPRFLMYFNRILKTLRSFERAHLVIATGKFSLWNVAFCSLIYKRSTLAVLHGSEVNFKTRTTQKTIEASLKRFDNLVAVSHYTKALIAHLHREVTVIPNGIALEKWPMIPTKKTTLPGSPVLTTVGRVSTRKGQLQVINLLPDLLRWYPNLQYHCVGIPTEAPAFLKQAQALGVESHVTFHGALSDDALQATLQATDVFVMLSTESPSGDVEGFGIAILEANALGIPAIGSKNCGIADAIEDGFSGFLVADFDAAAVTRYVSRILAEPLVYREQARSWAEQHDWNQIILHYIAFIR